VDDRKNDHGHVSRLFALHPGRQTSIAATPTLAEAARVSLDARGDGGPGWSKPAEDQLLGSAPRRRPRTQIARRATALEHVVEPVRNSPAVPDRRNFGATARLTGMLLQSQGGAFELLPALPAQWSSGDVRGLRTRGRLSINIKWQDRSRLNARSWRTAASTIFCVAEPIN